MRKWIVLTALATPLFGFLGCGGDNLWQNLYWWYDAGSTLLQDLSALKVI